MCVYDIKNGYDILCVCLCLCILYLSLSIYFVYFFVFVLCTCVFDLQNDDQPIRLGHHEWRMQF